MSALHELTIKAIRRAQQQGGIVDPVEDWAAIAELDRLARAATELQPEDRLLFLNLPVTIGNVSLYRLSWGASDWLTELAMVWFKDEPTMLDRAIAFAYVHSRNPSIFHRCSDSQTAKAEIIRWSCECSAPIEALLKAVDILTSDSSEPVSEGSQNTFTSMGPVFDRLMKEYHLPIDYFLWEISAMALGVLIRSNTLNVEKDINAMDSAGGRAPDVNSRMTKATIKFQRAAANFVSSVSSRQSREGDRRIYHEKEGPLKVQLTGQPEKTR